MERLHYPNESDAYRAARNALLNDEIALRAQSEAVAAKRGSLPPGGKVSGDYVFERIGKNAAPEKVKMSELFGLHDTLILYSFMYGPERELPCPGCTHLLDGLEARHGIWAGEGPFTSWRNRRSRVWQRGRISAAGIICR